MSDTPVLDLSQAESGGFDALDSGTYSATVKEVTMSETKGREGAALPAGTPMLKVQFRIDEEPYNNRRVFSQYVFAGAKKADGSKNENQQKTLGIFVSFLEAIGYDPAEIKSGKFALAEEMDNMLGRPCRVAVKKKQKYGTKPEDNEWDNEVTGVKPPLASEGGIE